MEIFIGLENAIRGGKIVWRIAEQPTLPVRMKMMYSTFKAALLGDSHDPFKPQTKELLEAVSVHKNYNPDNRQLSESTLAHWHDGSSLPNERHQKLITAICPDALNWLDGTRVTHPLERHLFVVDGMALTLLKEGEDEREAKRRYAEKAIATVDTVWSYFTRRGNEIAEWKGLKFQSQLQCIKGSGGLNAAVYDPNNLPQEVMDEFSYRDKYSLLSFLLAFADYNALEDKTLLKLFSIDLATVAAAIRIQNYLSEQPFAFSGKTEFGVKSAAIARLLWEPDQEMRHEWWELLCQFSGFCQNENFFKILLNCRNSYYSQFTAYGVSVDDLTKVTGLWVNPDAPDSSLIVIMRNCKLMKLPV